MSRTDDNFYPMTRSQKTRIEEGEKLLSEWKKSLSINDEREYIESFDGKILDVYEPESYSNKHQPYQYCGRELKYTGKEKLDIDMKRDGFNKMYVVSETENYLYGFQYIHHMTYDGTGFHQLLMNVVYKR